MQNDCQIQNEANDYAMSDGTTRVELAQRKLTDGLALDKELGEARNVLATLMNTRAVSFSQAPNGKTYGGDQSVRLACNKAPREYSTMGAFIDAQTERNEGPAAQRAALFLLECIRQQEAEVARLEQALINLLS